MTNERRLKLAVNPHLIDKNVTGEKRNFVAGFENVELTLADLAREVGAGRAFCAQLSGPRKAENFVAADFLAVDIDGGMTIEEALVHPIVQPHAGLIYTTARHAPNAHRFRIVFPLPRTITTPQHMRAALRALSLRLGGDLAATDATHIFYGNRNAKLWILDV